MPNNITIAKLNTLVTANAVQFTKELNSLPNHAAHAAEGIKKALESIGVGLSVAGIVEFGKSIFDFGDEITDMSRMAGMTTNAFQTLSLAGARSGVTMEMIAKAAETLRMKLQEAAAGAQPVRDELGKLHLTFAGLQALAPEKQWEVIAQRISNAKDQQEAMNIASELFGVKNAPKMKELLEQLAGGYDKLSNSVKGLKVDDDQLKTLHEASNLLTDMWTKAKSLGAGALVGAANGLKTIGGEYASAKGVNGQTFSSNIKSLWDNLGLGDGSSAMGGQKKTEDEFAPQIAARNAKAVGAAMAQGAADYAKAHPFDGIMVENAQKSKINSLLGDFFGELDSKSKATRDSRIKVDFPQSATDRLSRIGLITGDGVTQASEEKKQTDLLGGIKRELVALNQKALDGSSATYQ